MTHTLKTELKHAFTTPGFFIGLAGVVFVLLFASVTAFAEAFRSDTPSAYGLHSRLLLSALGSDAFRMTIPIWTALPYTASFCDDVKSGYIKLYLHRTTVPRYLSSRLTACLFSGALLPLLGSAIAYGLFALLLLPLQAPPAQTAVSNLSPLAASVCSACFVGAFCSCSGLLAASATGSRYMAYATPFVIYYLLIIFHERYFGAVYVLYPYEWLKPGESWPLGRVSADLLLAELTALLSLLFCLFAGRRLKRL